MLAAIITCDLPVKWADTGMAARGVHSAVCTGRSGNIQCRE